MQPWIKLESSERLPSLNVWTKPGSCLLATGNRSEGESGDPERVVISRSLPTCSAPSFTCSTKEYFLRNLCSLTSHYTENRARPFAEGGSVNHDDGAIQPR